MAVDPHNLLSEVEADLADVINAAAQEPQPFQVTYGLRTLAAEKIAVSTGHSETLHSRHLADEDGWAAAVDVTPLVNGKIDFCAGHEEAVYGQVAKQIKAAAERLSVDVQWGGDWMTFKDWGHFQLPWGEYP